MDSGKSKTVLRVPCIGMSAWSKKLNMNTCGGTMRAKQRSQSWQRCIAALCCSGVRLTRASIFPSPVGALP